VSRCLIVAELATAHHGDVGLAEAMIAQAAEAGADIVKVQSYTRGCINMTDAQHQWLYESWLDEAAHMRLKDAARQQGVTFMSTPMDQPAYDMLERLSIARKISMAASMQFGWKRAFVVSWPRGQKQRGFDAEYHLSTMSLYPTPLEAVWKIPLLDGWSDHCDGLSACVRAVVKGAKMVEIHFSIPGARQMVFDKSPDDVRRLRDFTEDIATIDTGVSHRFRTRWLKPA
jgi:sialic acid synthase SpsE